MGTPRPRLPDIPIDAGPATALSIQETFDQEPVDRFWKANTEAQIRRRVPTATEIDCHQTLCKITLAGSEHDITVTVDQMEGEQSLRGIAQSVLLTAPEKRIDGSLVLRAYARFDHAPEL